ncbi:hypothetical protein HNR02_006209 [Amycolatopsis endophytica]|uniref:Uncharacterized protein n=1 Tax=Amycolatopsis endophytica TaxID=860233 RepID=A0A853BDM2_9PSEU|nr:hypothetical protein [Amycolatopsis endophytica]
MRWRHKPGRNLVRPRRHALDRRCVLHRPGLERSRERGAQTLWVAFHADQQGQPTAGQGHQPVCGLPRVHPDLGRELVHGRLAQLGQGGEQAGIGGIGHGHSWKRYRLASVVRFFTPEDGAMVLG